MLQYNNSNPENNNEGFNMDDDFINTVSELPDKSLEKRSLTQEIFEWLEVSTSAVIVVVILFTLVFRVATIQGDSMKNTLIENDKVVITNLAYTPKQGDIVVISRNVENSITGQAESDEPIIKRVIAVGGQTVDIDFDRGIVYVDGVALEEDYISTSTTKSHEVEFPVYIPKGYIFVLGDNRLESLDSRSTQIGEEGLIDSRYVLGHAILRIFPFDKIGRLDNK